MRVFLDCYPCFLRQALEAARMNGAGEAQQRELLHRAMDVLQDVPAGATPPEIAHRIHRLVKEALGVADPYLQAKRSSTRLALRLLPRMRQVLAGAPDRLECAVRLAIAGNIIDFGPAGTPVDEDRLWSTVERALEQPFAIDDVPVLRGKLRGANRVLYLADNAGETVFDRLLIETLAIPTTYVVKGGPTLNDATLLDAQEAGLHGVADVIDNGTDVPGTSLSACAPRLRGDFARADIVIAKGQANYETLSDCLRPVCFLLKAKCEVIARDIGVPVGSLVVDFAGLTQV
jgi:uncharacterized protein with ATP-grasp and redox domains